MNLAFSPKSFSRCALSSSSFAKTILYVRKLVNTKIKKGITLLCIGKNHICISCVFNSFKYMSIVARKSAQSDKRLCVSLIYIYIYI